MKIQYPERGQPLDIDYLYQMAKSINNLNDKMAGSKTLSSIFDGTSQLSLSTNMIRFYSVQKNLSISTVAAGRTEDITINFDTAFTKPPVVTCTIQNNTSSIGNNAIVTVSTITTSNVKLSVLFNKAGAVNITLNVIAVGT
jgi:hypothetical protein